MVAAGEKEKKESCVSLREKLKVMSPSWGYAVLGYEPFYMLSGWNTYILVFAVDGLLQFFGWNSYSLFLI